MRAYYVDFLNGQRIRVEALDRYDAVAHATKESGQHYGDVYKVYNVDGFPQDKGDPCIYCGEPTDTLICSDKCQRDHFGMN